MGIGAAIRTGLQYSIGQNKKWALISSSNGKMQPEEFHTLINPIENNIADYVQGNRFLRNTSYNLSTFRKIAIPIFSAFTSIFLGRLFHRSIMRTKSL